MLAPQQLPENDLRKALQLCKGSFAYAGFFSLIVNLLMLVPSLYMLAVYDKVMVSGSESTLVMLTLITVFLFLLMGGLEWIRSRLLIAASHRLDDLLGRRVFDAVFTQTLATGGRQASAQPMSDLLQVRQFLTGPGLFAFFDAPWMPIYLALLFLFHPAFGAVACLSALILAGLTFWNEVATRSDLEQSNRRAIEASQLVQRNLRNAEVVEAMGMLSGLRGRWQDKQQEVLQLQGRASGKAGLINALSKTYRLTIQSVALGLGAYLAIHKEITPGLVIAGSILMGRALAPLDQMIAGWRGFLGARESYRRLGQLLQAVPVRTEPMPLPAPAGKLSLESLVVVPPGATDPVLKGLNATIAAGETVAVIGPSAAGKSTLARTVLGIYKPTRGCVRLDGAELQQWDRQQLGPHLGYLPQDVELLDGTVKENIARFGTADPDAVVAAAQLAGIHEMVLRLPQAYDTPLLGGGTVLSAGQQQRIGLARALYGSPRLIVLDEPNSNLDQAGEAALSETLAKLRQTGCTVLVITHRPNLLAHVDKVLLLIEGQIAMFGSRDEVLAKLNPSAADAARPAASLAR